MYKYANKLIQLIVLALVAAYGIPCNAESGRYLYVISDLHMGLGKVDSKKQYHNLPWDKTEDFRWHDEFEQFVAMLIKQSKGRADLVIAGDFLELWQSRDNLCEHDQYDKDISCNEEEALARVQRVVDQHRSVFQSLKNFVDHRENRVIIIPGNHDAALLFEKVGNLLLAQFEDKADHIEISESGYWLNQDGKILIEHGQQLKFDVNRFPSWPNPYIKYQGKNYLRKTWGEQFVQKFFNEVEDDVPLIDNISSEFEGFIAGVEFRRWAELRSALKSGIGFFLKHMSLAQSIQFLEEGEEIDARAVKKNEGTAFFYNSLPEDSALYADVKNLVESGAFSDELENLPDQDVQEICAYRSNLHKKQKEEKEKITIYPCQSSDTLSAAGRGVFVAKERDISTYIRDLENQLLRQKKTRGVRTYIYGHTHKYEKAHEIVDGAWKMEVLNTGAWQRIVTMNELKKIAENRTDGIDPFDLNLEDLPACYTYVVAEPYPTNKLNVELKKWGEGCSSWGIDIEK